MSRRVRLVLWVLLVVYCATVFPMGFWSIRADIPILRVRWNGGPCELRWHVGTLQLGNRRTVEESGRRLRAYAAESQDINGRLSETQNHTNEVSRQQALIAIRRGKITAERAGRGPTTRPADEEAERQLRSDLALLQAARDQLQSEIDALSKRIQRRPPAPVVPARVSYSIPFALLMLPVLIPLWVLGYRRNMADQRRQRGLCVRCGYDLTGNTSGVCPECGTPTR